jgi:hypothetical protein
MSAGIRLGQAPAGNEGAKDRFELVERGAEGGLHALQLAGE